MSRFFVMLNSPDGTKIMPLVDDEGDVTLWNSKDEAREAADGNRRACAFGFEVFERGAGCA